MDGLTHLMWFSLFKAATMSRSSDWTDGETTKTAGERQDLTLNFRLIL